MLMWTLIKYRKNDSFSDNYFFLIILPLFLIAKNLMLSPEHFQAGWTMAIGMFRVAFLVMLERTLTQFMKNVFQVAILRHPPLDFAIKGLAATLIFRRDAARARRRNFTAARSTPQRPLYILETSTGHAQASSSVSCGLGYLAIVGQLLINVASTFTDSALIGTASVHVFTFQPWAWSSSPC